MRKCFRKTKKNNWRSKKKTNENERLAAVINKDDHKDNYKEISEELVKERFDEIKELTAEINHDDLIYCFKNNIANKRFDDSNNSVYIFWKLQSGEMKLGEAKKLDNVFKSNVNEI